jgi:hypothetical protein
METVPQTIAPEPVRIRAVFQPSALDLPQIRFGEALRTQPEYRPTLHPPHAAVEFWETLAYLILWFSGCVSIGSCFIQ